ncbi:MAG TPA: hypothetical protein PK788_14275, partial [Gemmatimonadaceae bacterium]|nr:hypothetical protein [Gemmatimonadaceae bacterium]
QLRRRLRAAAQNAVLWGAGFFVASVALMTARLLLGLAPAGIGVLDGIGMGIRVAFWGGVCGLAFSAAVGLRFTGRRLADIRLWPFALGSALGIAVFVPLALQAMNILGGEGPIAWRHVTDDALWTGILGGVAGGLTLKLAQLADRVLPPGVQIERIYDRQDL